MSSGDLILTVEAQLKHFECTQNYSKCSPGAEPTLVVYGLCATDVDVVETKCRNHTVGSGWFLTSS